MIWIAKAWWAVLMLYKVGWEAGVIILESVFGKD